MTIQEIEQDTVEKFGRLRGPNRQRLYDETTLQRFTSIACSHVGQLSRSIGDQRLADTASNVFDATLSDYQERYGFIDLGMLILILRLVIWILGKWNNLSDSTLLRNEGTT